MSNNIKFVIQSFFVFLLIVTGFSAFAESQVVTEKSVCVAYIDRSFLPCSDAGCVVYKSFLEGAIELDALLSHGDTTDGIKWLASPSSDKQGHDVGNATVMMGVDASKCKDYNSNGSPKEGLDDRKKFPIIYGISKKLARVLQEGINDRKGVSTADTSEKLASLPDVNPLFQKSVVASIMHYSLLPIEF